MLHPQLEVFLQVADKGSFTKASEGLFISPPAVMNQINLLEGRLGAALFTRSSHGVALTEAGKALYEDARFLQNYAQKTKERVRRIAQAAPYVIRVGTSFLNPGKMLMELWSSVSDQHPRFTIKLVPFEDDRASILNTISALGKDIDFIVGACNSAQWLKRCGFHPLRECRFCCALPKRHPLSQRERLALSDLHGERLIMVREGDSPENDRIRDEIRQHHPQIQIEDAPYYYDMEVFNHCEQTSAVLLTLDIWADIHPTLQTVPLDWPGAMPFGLLYAKKPTKDALAFLKCLQ